MEMQAIVGEATRGRFLELATAMQSSEAPHYVTRALGEPHVALGMHWHAVRAQIEVGRQIFGVDDPSITLGPPPTSPRNEAWEQHHYHDIVAITQHIQLGQIMLAGAENEGDPRAVASGFGKPQLIDELGMPPAYPSFLVADLISSDPRDADAWLSGAHELLGTIEPPQAGLLIDQS